MTDLDDAGPAQVAQSENPVRDRDNCPLVLEEHFGYKRASDKPGFENRKL